jgi:pimeloyl-ACP methyl ester carboxylesterase
MSSQSAGVGAWWNPKNDGDGSYHRSTEIKIPVLAGAGHEDVFFPPINGFVLQQKLPGARLSLYPDSDHCFLFQYPETFSKEVVEFLDGNLS